MVVATTFAVASGGSFISCTRTRGNPADMSAENLCHAALRMEDRSNAQNGPCHNAWPGQRYFQMNLHPLRRLGTIEFRGHSATYDTERVARWVQFLLAFVEHFGVGVGKNATLRAFFGSDSANVDLLELQRAQRRATHKDCTWKPLEPQAQHKR